MTKATIEKQTPAEVQLKIIVSAQELQAAKGRVIASAKKDIKVAGFRPGQAPDAMVERQLDPAKLQMDVVEKILAASFSEAVTGHELKTLAQPKVEISKFVPYEELEYQATVAILPDIKLDYTKLRVPYTPPQLDEAEIEMALQNLLDQAAERKTVERAARQGDEVRLDFKGVREGKPVEGAAAQNSMIVIGAGRFIPGFEEELIGLKAEDTKDFDITFPKDYHASDLAGKKVAFSVTVHEVREITRPKADDAFAKKMAGYATLQELKDDIRKNLTEGKEQEIRQAYESAVLEAAVKGAKLTISPLLEAEQVTDLEQEFADKTKSQGVELKDWLKLQKKSEADFQAELSEEARRRIGVGLIIRDVISKRNITISVDEVEEQVEKMRTTYSDPEVLKHLDHDHFKNDLANRLVTQRAVDWLVEQARQGKGGK